MLGIRGRPVSVVYSWPTVKVDVSTGTGRFEGDINSTRTEISGAWVQEGQATPATLRRADYRAEHALDALGDYTFRSEFDLQGIWHGAWVVTLAEVKVSIRFALAVAKLPDGSYSAALSNVDEFGRDDPMPASEFEYRPPNVRMKWKWAGGNYEAVLRNGKLVGTWFQGGGGFPLVFERSAHE